MVWSLRVKHQGAIVIKQLKFRGHAENIRMVKLGVLFGNLNCFVPLLFIEC